MGMVFTGGPELRVLQSKTKRGARSHRLCTMSVPAAQHVLHCAPFGTARRADVDFAIQNA